MVNKLIHNKPKVVVGLSGGIDSAVSALLLKQQGYDVIGLFMQNWDSSVNQEIYKAKKNSSDNKCDSQIDYEDALAVAKHLEIPLYRVNFIKEYWDNVFTYFLDEYKHGRTPNPDVLCNKHIKFDAFLEYAFKQFDCDYIAMGHYAKVVHTNPAQLQLAKDQNKDQTYFLCALTPQQLSKVLFPLADLTKPEVRMIAQKNNLPNFAKKDSTGICFIGERNLKTFLSNYIPNQPGPIIDITTNQVVGQHIGTMYYTIGQRKGLNLGGLNERYFICKKDVHNSVLYVAPDSQEEKYLVSNQLIIKKFNWLYKPQFFTQITARFRHRQQLQNVQIEVKDNQVIVNYPKQKNVVVGQYCVLYQNNICVGGGVIEEVNKN